MSYATLDDLVSRYGEEELVQITGPASGVIDGAVVAGALADADAMIDGYLAGRYPLPLASVPPNLTLIACAVARYLVWKDLASEEVRKRYEDAIRYLERVASGGIPLRMDTAGQPDPLQGVSVAAGTGVMGEFL